MPQNKGRYKLLHAHTYATVIYEIPAEYKTLPLAGISEELMIFVERW
jgi:hypothetical protein